MRAVFVAITQTFRDAVSISTILFKILIPVVIIMKVLTELGLVTWLGTLFSPFMALAGLPGNLGIVFVTALLTNLYGGIIAFVTIFPETPLTVAQVTVIATMMLVAHNFPVELAVARKAGMRVTLHLLVRLIGAFLLGALLFYTYKWGGWLQQPATLLWTPPATDVGLLHWAWGELQKLAVIFGIVFAMLLGMRLLKYARINDGIEWLLRPILRPVGIGREATSVTLIGMMLGLAYGGGLIIREAQSGNLPDRDIFASITLMGLTHSVIEDTLLMMLIGGHLSGLLWGRIAFSLIAAYLIMRFLRAIPATYFYRYAFHEK